MAGSPPPPEGQSGNRWQESRAPEGGYAPAPPPPAPGQQDYQPGGGSNGVAIGALVCGILALLMGIAGIFLITIPFALILGIVGIVLGVMGLRRAGHAGVGRGQAIAGIVTGGIGLLATLAWGVVLALGWSAMVEEFGDPFENPEQFQERLEELEEQQEQP